MPAERRKFRREGEERRRDALIAATLDLLSEGGPEAATVRAIALRAGVTQGLIRHYFAGKEELLGAAYRDLMDRMTAASDAALADVGPCPVARLAAFVAAALRPPVVDGRALGLWAGFMHLARRDGTTRAIHEATYLGFRDRLEALIAAALPPATPPARLRAHAIACNAVLDGLWLEGSALPEAFGPGELPALGLASVGAILGLDLAAATTLAAGPQPAGRSMETTA